MENIEERNHIVIRIYGSIHSISSEFCRIFLAQLIYIANTISLANLSNREQLICSHQLMPKTGWELYH